MRNAPAQAAKLFSFLIWFFAASQPTDALYQEYQLAGSIASGGGYSFATGQYRLYANQTLLKKDFLGFEYDLDSLYTDYAYGFSDYFRAGLSGKAHIFDYQNLNHIVDSTTGEEIKAVALNAPFFRGQGYVEARYRTIALRYAAGAQKYILQKRETSNQALTVESPGTAFVHNVALGYWDLQQIKPYAFTGVAAYLSVEEHRLSSLYVWQSAGTNLSAPRSQVMVHELHARGGTQVAGGDVKLMAALRAGATNFALPGEAQDVIESFSIGGPESRYRRVAGYAFSEFRVPAFGIINLDAVIRMAGPVNLWLVADGALFDREYNARRFHAGAGAGLIIDLPDGVLGGRSAFFSRIEMPFFAASSGRFQVFLGMNGQIF